MNSLISNLLVIAVIVVLSITGIQGMRYSNYYQGSKQKSMKVVSRFVFCVGVLLVYMAVTLTWYMIK